MMMMMMMMMTFMTKIFLLLVLCRPAMGWHTTSTPRATVVITPSIPSPFFSTTSCYHHHRLRKNTAHYNNAQSSNFETTTTTTTIQQQQQQQQQPDDDEEDHQRQWELFLKHHAPGSWKGIWTTYNDEGEVSEETVASVDYTWIDEKKQTSIQQSHSIVAGGSLADSQTWMGPKRFEVTKTMPVAVFSPKHFPNSKIRLVSCSMVNGPTLLRRSGILSTELVLQYGDGRIRVIFRHGPASSKSSLPSSSSHKVVYPLDRIIVSREALRSHPPTPNTEQEESSSPKKDHPRFFRNVSPTLWQSEWKGDVSTWNTNVGYGTTHHPVDNTKGGSNDPVWHAPTIIKDDDDDDTWSMRLKGGLWIQCPDVLRVDQKGSDSKQPKKNMRYQISWIPQDDVLLQVQADVAAAAAPPVMLDDNPPQSSSSSSSTDVLTLQEVQCFELNAVMSNFPSPSSTEDEGDNDATSKEVLLPQRRKKQDLPKATSLSSIADNDPPNDDDKSLQSKRLSMSTEKKDKEDAPIRDVLDF